VTEATPGGPTVLVADEDVGFIWWLAELFAEFGYRSIPALGCRQALSLFRRSDSEIHIALIDPRLHGAARLISILRHLGVSKIVLIQEAGHHRLVVGVVATIERPTGLGPISRMEWRQKLQRLLMQLGSRAAS
jgi:hypothetical protein